MRCTAPVATQMRKRFVRFLKLFSARELRVIFSIPLVADAKKSERKNPSKKMHPELPKRIRCFKARTRSGFPLVQLTFVIASKCGRRDVDLLLTQDADLRS